MNPVDYRLYRIWVIESPEAGEVRAALRERGFKTIGDIARPSDDAFLVLMAEIAAELREES